MNFMSIGKIMNGFTSDHLRKIYSHIRERFSLRNILHVHGFVLGVAGRKIFLSHIGINFLFAKFGFIQLAFVKAVISIGVVTLFPVTQEMTLAGLEESAVDQNTQSIQEEGEQNMEDLKSDVKAPALDLYPALLQHVNDSLKHFQIACESQDNPSSFLTTLADTVVEDGSVDPLHVLASYCVTDQYDSSRYGKLHNNTVTSKADAIKILAKTLALGTDTTFDEEGVYLGPVPYVDTYHDGWYIEYVMYLYEKGILEGIGTNSIKGGESLKVLMPISKHEVKVMLKNLGVSNNYSLLNEPGSYVYRNEFAQIVIDAFPEKFVDYSYMRGGNVTFYKKFLDQIQGKNPATQGIYLQLLSEKLRESDPLELIAKQNLYVEGVDTFLQLVLSSLTK